MHNYEGDCTQPQRLEVRLVHPNSIIEAILENWLCISQKSGDRSRFRLQKALQSLRLYPLPFATAKECIILEGFTTKLCQRIDEQLHVQNINFEALEKNVTLYKKDINHVIESVKMVSNASKTKKIKKPANIAKTTKLTKKQQRLMQEEQERLKTVVMTPKSFRIILLVDIQETSGKNKKLLDHTRGYLETLQVQYEVRRLTVGDFLWIARDNDDNELVLPYIVERKRMDDLSSSIRDGRFHEQKHRLKQSALKNVIYLIEDYGDNEQLGLPLENLKQAISNTVIHNNFSIVHVENHWRAMVYLQTLTKLIIRKFKNETLISADKDDIINTTESHAATDNQHKLLKFKIWYEQSMRSAQLTIREVFIQQLVQLHSLSLEKALAITNVYSTPRSLLHAYRQCTNVKEQEQLLSKIRHGPMQRSIGDKISYTLYHFYNDEF